VLFGGHVSGSPDAADTWTFDGTTWTQLSPSNSPSARQEYGMAWDPTLSLLMLYGGIDCTTDACSSPTYLGDEWAFNGTTWYQGATYVNGGPREAPSLVQDPTNGQLLMFGGVTASLTYSETSIVDYLGEGERKSYSFDTKTIDDRSTIGVNPASRKGTPTKRPGPGHPLSWWGTSSTDRSCLILLILWIVAWTGRTGPRTSSWSIPPFPSRALAQPVIGGGMLDECLWAADATFHWGTSPLHLGERIDEIRLRFVDEGSTSQREVVVSTFLAGNGSSPANLEYELSSARDQLYDKGIHAADPSDLFIKSERVLLIDGQSFQADLLTHGGLWAARC
jgi:hypothetical protein